MNTPPTLPPRPPKPYIVHLGIDTLIAGAGVLVSGIILGLQWETIAAISLLIGAVAAIFTRRLEMQQLAERAHRAEETPES